MIPDGDLRETLAYIFVVAGSLAVACQELWRYYVHQRLVLSLGSKVIGYGGYRNKQKSFEDDRKIVARSEEMCQMTRDNLRGAIQASSEDKRGFHRETIKMVDAMISGLASKARGDPSTLPRRLRRRLTKLDKSLIEELSMAAKVSGGSDEAKLDVVREHLSRAGEALTKRTTLVGMR